jgi:EAL and modified HD-GYP domain-containing signal transduction protein
MLRWLARLFGGTPDKRKAAARSPGEGVSNVASFLGRSPILNRQLTVIGYEFQAGQAMDAALLDKLIQEGKALFGGRRLTFVPLHPLSLGLPQVSQLPAAGAVLLLAAPAQPIAAEQAEAILAQAQQLRGQGYSFAFDATLAAGPLAALLPSGRYLTLDVKGGDPVWLLEQQKRCAAAYPNAQLIARNIDSLEMLDACRKLSFHGFQGTYLTGQKDWAQPRVDGSRSVILELIGCLKQEDVDFKTLARIASQDVSLYYRLLRYANSAAFGLNKKYDSLEQAMVLLGRQGLHQWLTLMLFCSSKGGELDVALRETAFARARLVELLAQGKCSRAEGEQAFLVGLLSLVDALFQMPLEEALQKLALPEPVLDALLHRGGKFGTYLSLAIACEKGYEGAVEELARECGLSSDQVNAKHLAALNWALEFNDKLDELDRSEPAAG